MPGQEILETQKKVGELTEPIFRLTAFTTRFCHDECKYQQRALYALLKDPALEIIIFVRNVDLALNLENGCCCIGKTLKFQNIIENWSQGSLHEIGGEKPGRKHTTGDAEVTDNE